MSEKNSEKEQVYKGVFRAVKKDGTVYYRASLTRHGKHISLGSYAVAEDAHKAYHAKHTREADVIARYAQADGSAEDAERH